MASNRGSTKLYVGGLPETCRKFDLQKLFEKYGQVVECDIVKNYAFVHYEDPEHAQKAAEELDGIDFEGVNLSVQLSRSKVRQKPGMGGKGECFQCGEQGHWSRECPKGPSRGPPRDDPRDYFRRPPRPSPYPDPYRDPYREAYYRDRYAALDRYRAYADPYDRFDRLPPLPRDMYYRERDPYGRPPPEYYGRGRRSPTRDFYDSYYGRSYALPPPPGTSHASPSVRAPRASPEAEPF